MDRKAQANRPVTPKRVLVVDDNHDSAIALAALLRLSGHEAWVAHEGESALRLAAEKPPDVALLDIGLPGMNGYEVCRRLRAESWGARLMVIAVTGWGQDEDRIRAKEAGFDHHLVKPVTYETLSNLFESLDQR